jgi:hypothetical protein
VPNKLKPGIFIAKKGTACFYIGERLHYNYLNEHHMATPTSPPLKTQKNDEYIHNELTDVV